MTTTPLQEQIDEIVICPFLGMESDHQSVAIYPRPDHICKQSDSHKLTQQWQENYCLTEDFRFCPYYRAATGPPPVATQPGRLSQHGMMGRYFAILVLVIVVLGVLALVLPQFLEDGTIPPFGQQSESATTANVGGPGPDELPLAIPSPTVQPAITHSALSVPTAASIDSAAGPVPISTQGAYELNNEGFATLWARADGPVLDGVADRNPLWGEAPISSQMNEVYIDAIAGFRTVQYFDKARMEINDPLGNAANLWYITSGRLVSEMVLGRYQVGETLLLAAGDPVDAPIIDAESPNGSIPTYAAIGDDELGDEEPLDPGDTITQTLDSGEIVEQDDFAEYEVATAEDDALDDLDHAIASVFWEFLTGEVTVYENNEPVSDTLFATPFYLTGLPITEPYWAIILVDGDEQDILWQCFERRCLTYNPEAPSGLEIDSGNAGQHYYSWRYGTSE